MPRLSKTEARRLARTRWQEFLQDQAASQSLLERFADWLRDAPSFARILASVPLPDELDVLSLLLQLGLQDSVYLPRAFPEGQMEFRLLELDGKGRPVLEQGFLGLPEPKPSAPILELPLSESDLIVVPGLACNPQQIRLGRGGGYYDRFLAEATEATSCMLLPKALGKLNFVYEVHDKPVDIIFESRA